jgi:hypothetical protein
MAPSRVAARAVSRVSGMASIRRMLTSLWMTWTWQSMRPGINVRPPQSTTAAAVLLIGASLSSRTRSFSMSSS